MNLHRLGKHVEKRWLRPLGRRLRHWPLFNRSQSRIAKLEQRVDELESLVRELTGLAYLRLDRDAHDEADRSAA